MATRRRAAAGGETVGGRYFAGGQFIGAEYQDAELMGFTSALDRPVNRAIFQTIRHAAFSIRRFIRQSITRSQQPSEVGHPVHTRGRRGNVKNSIFAAIDRDSALIGPRFSFVGDSMRAHEFGLSRNNTRYDARPTAAPALQANLRRFADGFGGSIGQ